MPRYSQYSNLADVSVAPVTFTPAVFKPTEFRVEEPNWNLAHQAINEHNRIIENVAQNRGIIENAINSLDVDDSELEYMQDYVRDIDDKLNGLVSSGDYRTAMSEAIKLGRSAATDRRLLSRAKRTADYNKWRDETAKRDDIDELTRARLLDSSYNSGKVINDDGTVNDWKTPFEPVKYHSITDVAVKAGRILAERSKANEWNNKTIGNSDGSNSGNSSTRGGMYVKKYKHESDINAIFNELMKSDKGTMEWIVQDWENQLWIKHKLEDKEASGETLNPSEQAQLQLAKEKTDFGAGDITKEQYFANLVGITNAGQAYDNISTGSTSVDDFSGTHSNFVDSLLEMIEEEGGETTTTTGNNIEVRVPNNHKANAHALREAILEFFKKK